MDKMKKINIAKSFFSKYPPYLIFFVTARCNSQCKMCFYWKNIETQRERKELTIEEIKKIAKSYKKLTYLTISGGEPSLRKDLPEIVESFYNSNKVPFITITTNGLMPSIITNHIKRMLETCKKAFFTIPLSLDGIEEDHDKIRGVEGSFKKTLETYKSLRELKSEFNNFAIDVNTVVSSYNEDKIEKIFDYVNQNLDIRNHGICFARGNTPTREAKNLRINRLKEILGYIENLKRSQNKKKGILDKTFDAVSMYTNEIALKEIKTNKMPIKCLSGKKMVVINEIGEVSPCEILDQKSGSLRENDYDILKVLKTDQAKKIRKLIKNGNCNCTFECAIGNSIAYSPTLYGGLLKKMIKVYYTKK